MLFCYIVVYGFLEDGLVGAERNEVYDIQIGYRKAGGSNSFLRGSIVEVQGSAGEIIFVGINYANFGFSSK